MRLDANETFTRGDDGACFTQLVDHCNQVVHAPVTQHDIAAGRRYSAQKSASFDPVGHYLMRATMQLFNALNADAAGAMAFNFCAHLDEHFGQVTNLRLLRSILKNGFTFGQRCSHQEVFRPGDGHHVGGDTAAFKSLATRWQLGHHVTVLHHDVGAQRLHALDVLVHRA